MGLVLLSHRVYDRRMKIAIKCNKQCHILSYNAKLDIKCDFYGKNVCNKK